jgi:hypothetical protein
VPKCKISLQQKKTTKRKTMRSFFFFFYELLLLLVLCIRGMNIPKFGRAAVARNSPPGNSFLMHRFDRLQWMSNKSKRGDSPTASNKQVKRICERSFEDDQYLYRLVHQWMHWLGIVIPLSVVLCFVPLDVQFKHQLGVILLIGLMFIKGLESFGAGAASHLPKTASNLAQPVSINFATAGIAVAVIISTADLIKTLITKPTQIQAFKTESRI